MPNTTTHIGVRLDPAAQEALASVMKAIASPLRSSPTVSDAIRASLAHTAATLPAAQEPATASNALTHAG